MSKISAGGMLWYTWPYMISNKILEPVNDKWSTLLSILVCFTFQRASSEIPQQEIKKQESGGEMGQTGFVTIPFKTPNANMFKRSNCYYSCLSSSWKTRTTKSIFSMKVETFSKVKSRKLQPKWAFLFYTKKSSARFHRSWQCLTSVTRRQNDEGFIEMTDVDCIRRQLYFQ